MKATLAPTDKFRKQHGVKGSDGSYHLPVPPKDHPLARQYAAAALRRSGQITALSDAQIAAQVRKANLVLYGTATPSAADKAKARAKKRERDLAYFSESVREAYMDVPPIAGSMEQEHDALLKAAQADERFGGPAYDYDEDPSPNKDSVRPYHISTLAHFPRDNRVTISNGKTGDLYDAAYKVGDDGDVTFTSVSPAELQVSKRAHEALAAMRESGKADPKHVPFQMIVPIREAGPKNADGSYPVVALTVGPGNPHDKNYYLETFIDDAVQLLEGSRSWYDHPTATEQRDIPERSVLKLCGWFDQAHKGTWTDPSDPSATPMAAALANFHPRVGDPVVESLIRTCQEHGAAHPTKSPFVAFSINGMGVGSVGDSPDGSGTANLMERMTSMQSTDLVTTAGARGRFQFEEPPLKTNRSKNNRGGSTSTREASRTGFARFADSELVVDLRTDAEVAADAKTARLKHFRAIAESALNGPKGDTLREAMGVKNDVATKDLTDDEILKALDAIGIKESAIEESFGSVVALGSLRTRENDEPDEDDDDDDDDDEPETEDDDAEDEAVQEALKKSDLPPAVRKKIAKKLKSSKKTAESGATVTRLQKTIEAIGRGNVITAAMAERKIDAAHRPILESLCNDAESPEQIGKIVAAYAKANRVTDDTAGSTREASRSTTNGGGSFKPAFLK